MPKRALPGEKSLFRRKVRQPLSITLTRAHHRKLRAAAKRLGYSRNDVVGLLIDLYADALRVPKDLLPDDD